MILDITLDDKALQGLVAALPRQIFNAQRSAIGTTVTFARREIENRMALKTAIPKRVYRRVRVKAKRRAESGSVWLGYSPIKATYAGPLRQQKTGARAGKHFFKGGFVATMQSGHIGIFKRRGQERLHIDEQFVDLDIGLEVAEEVSIAAQQRLREKFIERVKAANPNLE